jgi:hypothetical protein
MFRETGLRLAGKDAALLHVVALHECASVDGDGVLTPLMVKDAANLFDLRPAKLTARLVANGVWHDAATLDDCTECSERTAQIADGTFLIHRWWEPLLHSSGKNDAVKRQRETRRKALNRNKPLVASIRNRDRDLCRYCGIDTLDSSGPDKRSALVRTLDHVDPWGGNVLGNVVVACKRCNGWKNERTPEQWLAAEGPCSPANPGGARELLKPGTRIDPADPTHNPADPAPNQGQEPAPRAPAREAGPGRIGTGRNGSGSGPESDREPAPDVPPEENR